jgi:FixJ family two-component response regulator
MDQGNARRAARKAAPIVAVIEDDEGVRDSVCLLLETSGVHCKEFSSAEAFLEAPGARRASCLIVDVDLPGIGGMELLERLGAVGVKPAAIVLSGRIGRAASEASRSAGRVFLAKPFDPELLLELVEVALLRADRRLSVSIIP